MRKNLQLSFADIIIKNLLPQNDPLQILFESLGFSFVFDHAKDKFKPKGALSYNPTSILKGLLIYHGLANSKRDLTFKLRYTARLAFLTDFSLCNIPSDVILHYFRKRFGPDAFKTDKNAKWDVKEMNFLIFGYKVHTAVTNDENTTPYMLENKRGGKNPIIRRGACITRRGAIVCKARMRLLYWEHIKKRRKYKFRCPIVNRDGACLFKDICWKRKYGPVFYLHEETPVMDRVSLIRSPPKFKEVYKKRAHVERFFSIIEQSHRLLEVRGKGIREVLIQVVLSISAYILRLIAGNKLKVGLFRVLVGREIYRGTTIRKREVRAF